MSDVCDIAHSTQLSTAPHCSAVLSRTPCEFTTLMERTHRLVFGQALCSDREEEEGLPGARVWCHLFLLHADCMCVFVSLASSRNMGLCTHACLQCSLRLRYIAGR